MRTALNTLYVTTQGAYLHLENESLRLEVDGQTKLRVPLHHLGGVVLFGNVLISPFAIHRCTEEGKSVVFLDRHGRFRARAEGPQSGNVLLRRAQYEATSSLETKLELSRRFVAGKLHNSRILLMRGAREASNEAAAAGLREKAKDLARRIEELEPAASLDVVRGIEGLGARVYFLGINEMVRANHQTFSFERRSRRPPRDAANALLSFAYSRLLDLCRSALESVGLDPQMGFLHEVRPGRPGLALDLMEEFRSLIADRVVLALINRRQVDGRSFDVQVGGAVWLNEIGRKTFLKAYEQRRHEEVTHHELHQSLELGLIPQVQARLLARFVRRDISSYVPFVLR